MLSAIAFQFLIGRLKTRINYFCIFCHFHVSIPHRQTQNLQSVLRETMTYRVSIPHRQTQNLCCDRRRLDQESGFQFLIGRLKTQSRKIAACCFYSVSIPHRQTQNELVWHSLTSFQGQFQFLIGRLKTRLHYCYQMPQDWCFNSSQVDSKPDQWFTQLARELSFNSSQVDSKHSLAQNFSRERAEVSIPHRQTQNQVPERICLWSGGVSIPHRQTQNEESGLPHLWHMAWFQFLIGRLKTKSFMVKTILS